MSTDEKPFTVRIRIGNDEIEVSGTHEEVMKTLGNVSELISKVTTAFGRVPAQTPTQESQQPAQESSSGEYPSVAIDPATPCPDAIVQILSTDWGRKSPRSLRELVEAMKVNAIHYPEGTVKGRLTDLTKRGILRRIKSEKGYEYILVKA